MSFSRAIRAGSVLSVQGAQDHMAGHGGLEGDLGRLLVADLALPDCGGERRGG